MMPGIAEIVLAFIVFLIYTTLVLWFGYGVGANEILERWAAVKAAEPEKSGSSEVDETALALIGFQIEEVWHIHLTQGRLSSLALAYLELRAAKEDRKDGCRTVDNSP